jgi:hypothetical protein
VAGLILRETLLDPTGMMSASARPTPGATRNAYPPEVFNLMTDILADLVLEDLTQLPQIPTGPHIDRCTGRENTVLLTQYDGK